MDIQIEPKLLPGRIIEVTDIGVKIELNGRMGNTYKITNTI